MKYSEQIKVKFLAPTNFRGARISFNNNNLIKIIDMTNEDYRFEDYVEMLFIQSKIEVISKAMSRNHDIYYHVVREYKNINKFFGVK
jgi:hypothetical protein